MTIELSAVLPRICFACVVGLIFFLILRSELNNLIKTKDSDKSQERVSSSEATSRAKRDISKSYTADTVSNSTAYTVVVEQLDNITEIKRELEENRLETDFLFWLVLATAFVVAILIAIATAFSLLNSGVTLRCFSRSRVHHDTWWETRDEDYTNYAAFVRQNTKLIEDVELVDGAIYVEPQYATHSKEKRRHLSTIDENGESNGSDQYKRLKRIIKTEYTVDLTPGVKGTYIIPESRSKQKWHSKPQMISLLYSAPDFRKSGMPRVCIPSK